MLPPDSPYGAIPRRLTPPACVRHACLPREANRDHAPAVGLSGGFEARLSRAWLSGLVTGAPVSARAGRLGSGVAVSGWAGTERWGVSDRRHARQPVEDKMHQRRGEACARQVERNAGFQLDDASGNLDEAQAEGVEL